MTKFNFMQKLANELEAKPFDLAKDALLAGMKTKEQEKVSAELELENILASVIIDIERSTSAKLKESNIKPQLDEQKLANLCEVLRRTDIKDYFSSKRAIKSTIPQIVEQIALSYGLHTPELILEDWKKISDSLFKYDGYTLRDENAVFLVDNRLNDLVDLCDSTYRYWGSSLGNLFTMLAHEITHIYQFTQQKEYALGKDNIDAKYKLMYFYDIFFDSIPEDCILPKVSDKVFRKDGYKYSPMEIDARIGGMQFVEYLLYNKKLSVGVREDLKVFMQEEWVWDAGMEKNLGTKMFNALQRKKSIYEFYFGKTQMGEAVLSAYDQVIKDESVQAYVDYLNNYSNNFIKRKGALDKQNPVLTFPPKQDYMQK